MSVRMRKKPKDYAIYRGDEFITLGSAEFCAKQLGVKPETIRWLTSHANALRNVGGNRIEAIVIEDDEEME